MLAPVPSQAPPPSAAATFPAITVRTIWLAAVAATPPPFPPAVLPRISVSSTVSDPVESSPPPWPAMDRLFLIVVPAAVSRTDERMAPPPSLAPPSVLPFSRMRLPTSARPPPVRSRMRSLPVPSRIGRRSALEGPWMVSRRLLGTLIVRAAPMRMRARSRAGANEIERVLPVRELVLGLVDRRSERALAELVGTDSVVAVVVGVVGRAVDHPWAAWGRRCAQSPEARQRRARLTTLLLRRPPSPRDSRARSLLAPPSVASASYPISTRDRAYGGSGGGVITSRSTQDLVRLVGRGAVARRRRPDAQREGQLEWETGRPGDRDAPIDRALCFGLRVRR